MAMDLMEPLLLVQMTSLPPLLLMVETNDTANERANNAARKFLTETNLPSASQLTNRP